MKELLLTLMKQWEAIEETVRRLHDAIARGPIIPGEPAKVPDVIAILTEKRAPKSLTDLVFAAVQEHHDGITSPQLNALLPDANPASVRSALDRLRRQGKVFSQGTAPYLTFSVTSPEAAISPEEEQPPTKEKKPKKKALKAKSRKQEKPTSQRNLILSVLEKSDEPLSAASITEKAIKGGYVYAGADKDKARGALNSMYVGLRGMEKEGLVKGHREQDGLTLWSKTKEV